MRDAELKWHAERQALQEQALEYKTERDRHQARLRSMGEIISPILTSLNRHLSELLDLQHQE
jgi:anaerobic ribonucleoside-triphosphate reductase